MTLQAVIVAAVYALVAYLVMLLIGTIIPQIGGYAWIVAVIVFLLTLVGWLPTSRRW